MKKAILRVLLIAILLTSLPFFSFSKSDKEKTVVFLCSFNENNRWTKQCRVALQDKFKEEGYSVKLNCVYLDSKNIIDPVIRKNIFRLYFSEHKEHIDAIVAFDYVAADLVLTYTDSNISKIPIVFISELEHERNIEMKNVTGIISDYGIEQTYITGLKMFPKTKKVYVWADKSPTGLFFINQAKHKLKDYEEDMKIEYGVDANSRSEFVRKCKNVEANSIIIFCTWQVDDKGICHAAADLYPEFVKSTKAPIFTTLDSFMGCGFIGGYVQSPENNARAAALKTIRIFKGEKPQKMALDYIQPISIFDAKAIREKGGNRSAVNNDSKLINSFTLFLFDHIIWIIFSFTILLISIIVIIQQLRTKALLRKIKNKDEEEKKMKLDIKLLSFTLPSLNTVSWSYDERKNKFIYGDSNLRNRDNLEIIDSFEKILHYIHPDDKERIISFVNNFIKKDSGEFSINYRGNYTGKGDYSWWECRGILETREDKKGKYKVLYGMDINIDKHKEIEKQLSDALEKAVQSDKLKSAFLANISHEIRTPLNAIIGFSDLIISTDNLEEKEEYRNIIRLNNDVLLNLINDILDLSKIEAGFIEIKAVEFDLKTYFDELTGLFDKKLDDGVELICENPYKSCIVEFDKSRLTQIMTNFINNAIKFTHKGYIKFGYDIIDNGIKIYCKDTGIGIKPEDIDRVFNRFEKLNSFEQGTGLGLAICKSIIDAFGGKCGVDSKYGEGSNFWAWMPCDKIILLEN